jgi:hypothetical protein
MKTRFALVFLLITTSFALQAQTSDNEPENHSGNIYNLQASSLGVYVSFHLGNASLREHNALMGQMRLAARFNHNFSVGIAGNAFSDAVYGLNYDRPDNIPDGYYVEGGYGGFFIEPVFAPEFPVHLSFPLILGAGAVVLTEENYLFDSGSWEDETYRNVLESAAFVIIEPGVELEVKITDYVMLSAGVSYRATSGIKLDARREYLMNGISVNGGIKLGLF